MRIATFNLENFDNSSSPSLADRIAIMRPQLQRIDANIICFQEVHAQGDAGNRSLEALDQLISGTRYETYERRTTLTLSNELYDVRNLVTLSEFPIKSVELIRDSTGPQPIYQQVTRIPPDESPDPIGWERPLLYTVIDWNGQDIHLINLHMKSKIATVIKGQKSGFAWKSVSAWAEGSFISSMKRVGQALQARIAIDKIFDDVGNNANVVICGDFNAESDEVPLRAIIGPVEETGNPEHAPRVMIPCENNIPEPSRFSLLHLGKGEMLDHVLASRNMIQYFKGTEIHNEALPDESGAFRTDDKFPESDHAPVVASFREP